jgi:transitional endoplasmic reticulum ATPase
MKQYGAHPINGMLLVGPQGCGKSFIAEKFAEESGMSFCLVKASDLACTYVHGTQQRMAQLFNQAEDHAPCVICLDEMDAVAPDRSNPRNTAVADSVNELLSQMNNCWERGIFIIGTTNCLDLMDPAVLRKGRLDETIFIPMPDFNARKGMFHLLLSRTLCDSSINEDGLANATNGYASADIATIVNKTALQACRKRIRVSMPSLIKAINSTTPSVTNRQLRRFDEMRRQILGQETGPAHIGFR